MRTGLKRRYRRGLLEIKLNVSPLNFDSLEAVKQRLAQLKIEPITPETKTAIKSPLSIIALTKYTKQMVAYNIQDNMQITRHIKHVVLNISVKPKPA